jgi:chromosome partitioning protein
MKNVLICNQKGGVGKTLIADELAFGFERDQIPFSLYDLDQQGGLIHEAKENDDAAVAIIDTPGALQSDLKKWMDAADLIIIPTMMSNRDVPPLELMIELTKEYQGKKPVLFVLNRWNHYNITKDFIEWFDEKYPELQTAVLSDCTAFNQAGARGISIKELSPRSSGAKQMSEIYGFVKTALKLKEGWR